MCCVAWHSPVFRIALTGTLCSGKSTALKHFSTLQHCFVASADTYAHLWLKDAKVRQQILSRWGERVLKKQTQDQDQAKEIDRKKLASIVFDSPRARQQLNKILHPLIHKSYQEFLHPLETGSISIYEIPLLFESYALDDREGMNAVDQATVQPLAMYEKIKKDFDLILVVVAKRISRQNRAIEQKGWTEGEFTKRDVTQFPMSLKKELADQILYNDSNSQNLASQVQVLHQQILRQRP